MKLEFTQEIILNEHFSLDLASLDGRSSPCRTNEGGVVCD